MSQIENKVVAKILSRAEVGLNKYGTTMSRDDLSRLDWLKHAQEEAMDLAVYLQKLIDEEEKKEPCEECCSESRIPKWTRTSSLEEPETKACKRCCVRSNKDFVCYTCK
tara:strand:- start:168 stop:494 length:327 start_codon:yes stop_codon:yes gene_type:complete